MPAYHHLLVAVDLSPDSEAILQQAKSFAALYGARISLIHVVEQARISEPYLNLDYSSLERQIKIESVKRITELAANNAISSEDCITELGVASQLIHEYAEKLGVDLIYLGSHGRHGVGLLLGSTANAVLHGASCDVLAVRIDSQD